ncbi:MAG TPA: hypothetical protein VLG50_06715 [Candidatus Saccharimonadales bacterium]|nr:hypothetical protein [Candidatus Saccharimonadales bacterium]
MESELVKTLVEIKENDTNYSVRYTLVLKAMYLASVLNYETGIRLDSTDDHILWWVAWIILPDIGEVSWHNPSKLTVYSEYSTDEKYNRCHSYCNTKK